jgi:hypothetical protein
VIDSHTVVRLKRGLLPFYDKHDWGSRTDYLCARSPTYHPDWLADAQTYRGCPASKKPTTGLCAVLEARRRFPDEEIAVIGFDRLMHPELQDPPNTWLAHDKWAEHRLLKDIGVRELEQVC